MMAPECKLEVMSGTCISATEWKTQATKTCAAAGGKLIALGVAKQCAVGSWAQAEYTCCGTKDAAPHVDETATTEKKEAPHTGIPTITLPAPSLVCDTHDFGTAETCTSKDDWRYTAAKFCGKSGADVREMRLHGECKGGTSFEQIECCQAADRCETVQAAPGQCIPQKTAAEQAAEACKAVGGKVTGFRAFSSCGAGLTDRYTFTCCAD